MHLVHYLAASVYLQYACTPPTLGMQPHPRAERDKNGLPFQNGPDRFNRWVMGMPLHLEPDSFFAEVEGEGLVVGLWGDHDESVTLVLLDAAHPQGSFFTVSPELAHDLSDALQACSLWLRAKEDGAEVPGGEVVGCGRRDYGSEPNR